MVYLPYGYQGQLEQKHPLIGYKLGSEKYSNIGDCVHLSRSLKEKVGIGAGISTKGFKNFPSALPKYQP